MKAYKLKDDKGRIIIMIDNQALVIATPTEPQYFIGNYYLDSYIKQDKVEEIDLLKETWIHPHLFKPLKNKVKELLG